MSEGKGHLCADKTLKNAANYTKHHHLYDSLDVLAKHLVHHIGVSHHVHRICSLNFFVEVTIVIVAEEGFSDFYRLLRQPFSILADTVAPLKRHTFFSISLSALFETLLHVDWFFWQLTLHVCIFFKVSSLERAV